VRLTEKNRLLKEPKKDWQINRADVLDSSLTSLMNDHGSKTAAGGKKEK